jgi:hypothetical protein
LDVEICLLEIVWSLFLGYWNLVLGHCLIIVSCQPASGGEFGYSAL